MIASDLFLENGPFKVYAFVHVNFTSNGLVHMYFTLYAPK